MKKYIVIYIVPFKQKISRLFYVLHAEVTAAVLEL